MSNPYYHIPYQEIEIGQKASMEVLFTEEMVNDYSALIGDTESFHVSEEAASLSKFKVRVVHGAHLLAYISVLIGKKLPGFGTLYLSHELKFYSPVYLGEKATFDVKVLEKWSSNRLLLETTIHVAERLIFSGNALVMTWK